MKTKFFIQLFLLAFVSFSLYSCTADVISDTEQKNNVVPKVASPVADDGTTVVEPIVIKDR